MFECVHIMLQDIHEHSDWIPRPDGSVYVMKTMITTKTMLCENIFQSIEDERRKSRLSHDKVVHHVVHRLTHDVLQFKLISVRHVIT